MGALQGLKTLFLKCDCTHGYLTVYRITLHGKSPQNTIYVAHMESTMQDTQQIKGSKENVTCRFPSSMLAELRVVANEQETTISQLLRLSAKQYLRNLHREQAAA